MATSMMKGQIKKSGIATIPELLKLTKEMGGHFHACEPSMAMFKLKREDLIAEVEDIIGVAGF